MAVDGIGVILPAGGSGERMEMEIPKQFCHVMGTPVLVHTVEAFHRLPVVKFIILVAPSSNLPQTKELMKEHDFGKVAVVEGGSTRHRSIRNGIFAIEKLFQPPEIVIIHDGVRLIAPESVIISVAAAAKTHGAAGVVRPLTSTVVQSDADGYLAQSLDRSKFRASEMPQAFQYSVICRAYEKCDEEDLEFGTECLLLALKHCQVNAKLVDGPDCLWKVTHKKDLYAAEGIMRENLTFVGVTSFERGDSVVTQVLQMVKKRFKNVIQIPLDVLGTSGKNCNSFILLCPDGNLTFLQEKVKQHFLEKAEDEKARSPVCDLCIIGIMQETDRERQRICDGQALKDFNDFCSSCSKSGILLTAVLMPAASDAGAAGTMAAELVWLRNKFLCGQLLRV